MSDLGPMPDPESTPAEEEPGGPDSESNVNSGDTPGDPAPRDLDPDDNPAVDDVLPDEVSSQEEEREAAHPGEPDETGQEPRESPA